MNKILPNKTQFGACIKVVGVGGSGGNAINHMIDSGINGVDFIAVNCDVQDLRSNEAEKKVHIGKNLTKGLGAGMNPEIGRQAAEETKNEIQDVLKGADLVFITCGLGGGTGTGAAPVVAEIARQQDILTIAVVTKPFYFEGSQRARIAESGLEQLTEVVDTVIVIPNDRLLKICNQKTTLKKAFAACDDVLKNAVQGISELIIKPGIINLDFADIRTIMAEAGPAMMGVGQATGNRRASDAARRAISSPLLDISIEGAQGILFAIAGGENLTLYEISEAAKTITESVDPEAKIIFGAFYDKTLKKGELKVTVIAAGLSNSEPNIATPTHLKITKKESSIKDKNKFNEEEFGVKFDKDIDTPAFLRGPRQ